uniref:Uncharacterized protein n=1 Tax=Arundo donax TaxID=35708 RepID=A0A0A9E512_ARUDO
MKNQHGEQSPYLVHMIDRREKNWNEKDKECDVNLHVTCVCCFSVIHIPP